MFRVPGSSIRRRRIASSIVRTISEGSRSSTSIPSAGRFSQRWDACIRSRSPTLVDRLGHHDGGRAIPEVRAAFTGVGSAPAGYPEDDDREAIAQGDRLDVGERGRLELAQLVVDVLQRLGRDGQPEDLAGRRDPEEDEPPDAVEHGASRPDAVGPLARRLLELDQIGFAEPDDLAEFGQVHRARLLRRAVRIGKARPPSVGPAREMVPTREPGTPRIPRSPGPRPVEIWPQGPTSDDPSDFSEMGTRFEPRATTTSIPEVSGLSNFSGMMMW